MNTGNTRKMARVGSGDAVLISEITRSDFVLGPQDSLSQRSRDKTSYAKLRMLAPHVLPSQSGLWFASPRLRLNALERYRYSLKIQPDEIQQIESDKKEDRKGGNQ